jgi:WD40 repeat protein
MRKLILPVLIVGIVSLSANSQPAQPDLPKGVVPVKVVAHDAKVQPTYENVDKILVNKCLYCHSGNLKEGKLDLASYETLMKGGKRGVPVVAGKGGESLLWKLAGRQMRPIMPPKSEDPLTPEELALIKAWIDGGAKPPTEMKTKTITKVYPPPAGVHPVRGVAVSPDKSMVAASRGNQIHIYDAGSGAYIRSLLDPQLVGPDNKPLHAAHLSLIESLAISPDGKYIVSGAFQEVVIWDLQTGTLRHRLPGYADKVVALAFSPDSKLLAAGGGVPTEDGEIRVYDVMSGKMAFEIKSGHSDTVFGLCFSPDGKMLASCGADKFVKAWEVPGGKFVKSFEGHTHHVLDVSWRGDGKVLASGGADNVVKVWNFENGEQLRTINAHTKQVTRLQFIGKTNQFVTCSGDMQVKGWNSDNGQGNGRNFAGGSDFLYALGVSPDGNVVAAGGEDGITRLYVANAVKVLLPPGVEAPK